MIALAKRVDPKQQFSKKMAGRTEWFWFGYMLALIIAIVLAPEAALAGVYLGIMVTLVMMVSVLAYTSNSKTEKGLYWSVELAKALAGKKTNTDKDDDGADSEAEDGESNG